MLARSRLAETMAVESIKLGTRTGTGPTGLVWRIKVSASSDAIRVAAVGRNLVDVSVSVFALRRGTVTEVLELRSLAFAAVE